MSMKAMHRSSRCTTLAGAFPVTMSQKVQLCMSGVAAASDVVGLDEKPAMAFEIFRPVPSPGRPLFDHRQNRCTCGFRPFKMSLKIVHVDEHAIDDPGHRGPLA